MPSTRIDFTPDFPLAQLKPADYNPRRIKPDAFEKLKASLAEFGVCKPVILNRNGTLVAGHQRTKAMTAIGMTTTPVLRLDRQAARQDEIRFNLFHNSIETDSSPARITGVLPPQGYVQVGHEQVDGTITGGGVVLKETAQLLARYGPWGSVVATPDGNVVANSDYALACRAARMPVLVYVIPDAQVSGFLHALSVDYGEYHYAPLGVKNFHQLHCQLNRLRGRRDADGDLVAHSNDQASSLYALRVLPHLAQAEQATDVKPRLVDFGCGHGDYVKSLRSKGYRAVGYEPHLQPQGSRSINVRGVVLAIAELGAEVRARGLFDVAVLDSVLNSTTSLEFEDLVLTSCVALMRPDGVFFTNSRNLDEVKKRSRSKKDRSRQRMIEFLDPDNYSATYRDGVWTMQHFHDRTGLADLLGRYFEDVQVGAGGSHTTIHAVCRKPRPLPLERVRAALDVELNMELPGGFRHDRHGPTLDAVMAAYAEAHGL